MKSSAHVHKAGAVIASAGLAAAVAGTVLFASPAFAAQDEIVGSASVVLDFTTPGEVAVDVNTQNLSTVTAVGAAYVDAPDGTRYEFGPRTYAAGEFWVFSTVLDGYTCDDLDAVSAAAFGFREGGERPEWTSGVVSYPDDRVTVIGCDSPPVTPVDPETPVTPETPVDTTTPTTTTTTTTTAGTNALPPSKTDGALLAATGSNTAAWGTTLMAGAVALVAVGTAFFIRGRRISAANSE